MSTLPYRPSSANGTAKAGNYFRIGNAVIRDHGARIGPLGVAVFAALAIHRDKDEIARPSYGKIAKLLGISRRTVIRVVQQLEDAGLVKVERQGEDGCHHVNHYRLLDLKPIGGGGVLQTPVVSASHQSGVPQSLGVVSASHQGGVPQSPKQDTGNKTKGNKGARVQRAEAFNRFWAAYPKKRNKPDAQKAWDKVDPSPELTETIISAVNAWKQSREWLKNDGEFIPYPASWLNGRRWEDELPSQVNGRQSLTLEEARAEATKNRRQMEAQYGHKG